VSAALLRLPGADWAPYAILPLLALATLPTMSFAIWLTLTVAGIAMGMMLFLMAAGLTLIFGLMQVFTFAHGAFITLGAYLAVTVVGVLAGWSAADSWWLNLAVLAAALLVALVASGAVGFVFERIIIRRVYGAPLRQILITVGGLIIAEQLVVAIWGRTRCRCRSPRASAAASSWGALRSRSIASSPLCSGSPSMPASRWC
jgi:branched-chain amino acid transport system permease protein